MFNRILVPTDFSEPSDAGLAYARVLAAKFGASLNVLHVVEDQFVTGPMGAAMFVPHTPGTVSVLIGQAREYLHARVTPDDRARYKATTELIVGTAARTIAAYAGDNGYDLIVMGTHGPDRARAPADGQRGRACGPHRTVPGTDGAGSARAGADADRPGGACGGYGLARPNFSTR